MDTILQNPWLQGTAIGLLLLACGVALKILYHELKRWQDSYIALVKTTLDQNSQLVASIRQQTEVVENLGEILQAHTKILETNEDSIRQLTKHFDIKSLVIEALRDASNK